MAIKDWNGSAWSEIGKLYDNNGSANTQIGKVYDNNGTTSSLIYQDKPAPMSKTLEVSTVQKPWTQGSNVNTTTFSVPSGYETVTITDFKYGTSYGNCRTIFYCTGSSRTEMRNVLTDTKTILSNPNPLTTLTKTEGIKEVGLTLEANYNPNVSGQHTSAASVTFTLS